MEEPKQPKRPHSHTCKCGRVWACNLVFTNAQKKSLASHRENCECRFHSSEDWKEKMESVCWWDTDPVCGKCEFPEIFSKSLTA